MKLQIFNRKLHSWLAISISIPLLIIVVSGLMLQFKKHSGWIQPEELRGTGTHPRITFHEVLEICKKVPEAGINSWHDVNRVDIRPSKGMMKIWAKSNWEIQIDIHTGDLLQVAFRRSDLIEAIHDGSFWHDSIKYFVFIPSAIALLILLITGVYLFFLPVLARRSKRKHQRTHPIKTNDPSLTV